MIRRAACDSRGGTRTSDFGFVREVAPWHNRALPRDTARERYLSAPHRLMDGTPVGAPDAFPERADPSSRNGMSEGAPRWPIHPEDGSTIMVEPFGYLVGGWCVGGGRDLNRP